MVDANGTSSSIFTIDNNGNNVTTGNPITLCPTITASVPSVTFNITSLVDAVDPNNCEIPITSKSKCNFFYSASNSGILPLTPITFCTTDPVTDISNYLSNFPDNGGTWTYSGTGTNPVNIPFVGLNYLFDPKYKSIRRLYLYYE